MLIFLFLRLHRPQLLRIRNIELGGRGYRELTLDANRIEQMLKYRKASFPKRVSTTFVAHRRLLCPLEVRDLARKAPNKASHKVTHSSRNFAISSLLRIDISIVPSNV